MPPLLPRRAAGLAGHDDRREPGHAQREQLPDEIRRDLERAGVRRVALDLALAAAVVADVELDRDAARARRLSRSPPERDRLALRDRDRVVAELERRDGLGFERERSVCAARGAQADQLPCGRRVGRQ